MADQRSARKRVSDAFFEQTGQHPYSPEFIRSLIHTMRDPDACYTERVWAWHRWRAWGNSSLYAVSHWDPAKAFPLGQNDCALDLMWFLEGKAVKDIAGASQELRQKEYPKVRHLKNPTSRSYAKLAARELIDIKGKTAYLRHDPPELDNEVPVPGSRDWRANPGRDDFHKDKEFIKYLTDLGSRDWEDWLKAKSEFLKKRTEMRSRYQNWRIPVPAADASLFTEIPSNATTNREHTHTVADVPLEEPAVCAPPPVVPQPETPPPPVSKPPRTAAAPALALEPRFDSQPFWEVFWKAYTGHPYGVPDGELAARAWWKLNVLTQEHAVEIISGLNGQIEGDRWSRGIGVPNAIRFLREHKYRQKAAPKQVPAPSKRDVEREKTREFARRMDEALSSGRGR